MAKSTLPTNFVDDIIASSMGGRRRYKLIENPDGTVSLEDVTDYTQEGSSFGAAQVNATNTAVNNSADKANIIDDLDDLMANKTPGKIAGALAVAELNNKINSQEVLWERNPGWLMAPETVLTLPEKISEQKNGIILVWSRHDEDTAKSLDYGWHYDFIPKSGAQFKDGSNGHNFFITSESLGYVGSKYLYIEDAQIKGSTNNAVNKVGNGINITNRGYALRRILKW